MIHRSSDMKLEKTHTEAQTYSRKLQGTVEHGQCHVLYSLLACEPNFRLKEGRLEKANIPISN